MAAPQLELLLFVAASSCVRGNYDRCFNFLQCLLDRRCAIASEAIKMLLIPSASCDL